MTKPTQSDLDFRPRTYWLQGADRYVRNRPKGTVRRRLLAEAPSIDQVPDVLASEALPEADREAWGRIHPSMMGGEYLPDLQHGEVEIARIEMQSTTGDVISLRARRVATGRIQYWLCDEYPEHGKVFDISPVESDEPLTLGEIAALLDGARCSDAYEDEPRVIWGILQMNRDNGSDDREQLESFISVVSPFYPGLTDYFRRRIRQWIAQGIRRSRAEEQAAARLEAARQHQLAAFAAEIDCIVERETAKQTWSGAHAGMGRGLFRQKLRRRLEQAALDTGRLPEEFGID